MNGLFIFPICFHFDSSVTVILLRLHNQLRKASLVRAFQYVFVFFYYEFLMMSVMFFVSEHLIKMKNENRYRKLSEAYRATYPNLRKINNFNKHNGNGIKSKILQRIMINFRLKVSLNARAAKQRSAQLQWWMKTSSTKSAKGI